MDEITVWERLVGSLGVPAAILFFLMFVGWRCARALAPHVPTIVNAYKAQSEATAALASQTSRHTEQLDTIQADVGEVKQHVKLYAERG